MDNPDRQQSTNNDDIITPQCNGVGIQHELTEGIYLDEFLQYTNLDFPGNHQTTSAIINNDIDNVEKETAISVSKQQAIFGTTQETDVSDSFPSLSLPTRPNKTLNNVRVDVMDM